LVSNWRRKESIGTSSSAPDCPNPALLTSAPTLPCSRSMTATAFRIESSFVTSSASVLAPASRRVSSISGRRAVA
jgi:hypothetical protein